MTAAAALQLLASCWSPLYAAAGGVWWLSDPDGGAVLGWAGAGVCYGAKSWPAHDGPRFPQTALCAARHYTLERQTKVREDSTITEKAPTMALSLPEAY